MTADSQQLIRELVFKARDEASRQIVRLNRTLDAMGAGTESLKKTVLSLPAAFGIGFSMTAIGAFAKEVVDTAGALQDLEDQTGISAQLLSGMKSILEEGGTSAEAFARGIFTAQRNLGQIRTGTEPAALAVKALGLNLDELRNASPQRFLELIADRLGKIENPAQRAAIGSDLLGRQFRELNPVLQQLAGNLDELKRNGMNPEDIKRLDEFGDALTRLKNTVIILSSGPLAKLVDQFRALLGMMSDREKTVAAIDQISDKMVRLAAQIKVAQEMRAKGSRSGLASDENWNRMLAERDKLLEEQAKLLKEINAQQEKPKPPPAPFRQTVTEDKTEKAFETFMEGLRKRAAGLRAEIVGLVSPAAQLGIELDAAFKATGAEKIRGATQEFEAMKGIILDLAAELEQYKNATLNAADAIDADFGKDLEEAKRKEKELQEQTKKLAEEFDKLRDAARGAIDSQDSAEWLDAVEGVHQEVQRQADEARKVFEDTADAIANAWGEMLTGLFRGEQDFGDLVKNFFRNIAIAIADESMKKAVVEPLRQWFSDIFAELFKPGGAGSAQGGGMMGGLFDQIGSTLKTFFQSIFQNLSSWFSQAFGWIMGLFGGLFGGAGGSAMAGSFLPIADAGGIVTRPTLARLAVNQKPEAIIPLDRLASFGGGMPGRPIHITLINDYSNAFDPRGMKMTPREVMGHVMTGLDHNPTFRNSIKGAARG